MRIVLEVLLDEVQVRHLGLKPHEMAEMIRQGAVALLCSTNPRNPRDAGLDYEVNITSIEETQK